MQMILQLKGRPGTRTTLSYCYSFSFMIVLDYAGKICVLYGVKVTITITLCGGQLTLPTILFRSLFAGCYYYHAPSSAFPQRNTQTNQNIFMYFIIIVLRTH